MINGRFFLVIILGIGLMASAGYAQQSLDTLSVEQKLNTLSHAYYEHINKDPKLSLRYAEKAYSYYDSITDERLRFTTATNYITALYVNELFTESLAILKHIENHPRIQEEKALYHTLRGLVESDLNFISEAEESYTQALQIYQELGDKDNEFTILNNLGLLYNNIGDYKKSLDLYLQCYAMINDLKIKVDRYKYFMNVGTVSYNLNDYNSALSSFENALREAKTNVLPLRIYRAEQKIAETQVRLKHLDKAVLHYTQAIEGYEQLGLNKDVCTNLLHLGDLYFLTKRYEEAFACYMRSKNLATSYHFVQVKYEAYEHLGNYYQQVSKFDIARGYYKKVIEASDRIVNQGILRDAYKGLFQIEKQNKNSTLALGYLEQFLRIENSIKEKQFLNQNEQIEIQNELKRKELELANLTININLKELQLKNRKQQIQGLIIFTVLIALFLILLLTSYFQKRKAQRLLALQNEKINRQYKKLSQTNIELKARRKELAGLNNIKDELLSIIAHDVKSPMTDLRNLLVILRRNLSVLDKKELEKNLAIIESTTSNQLNFLNNILNWTISQSSGITVIPSEFNLNELVEANIQLVESSLESKNLTLEFERDDSDILFKSDLNIVDFALRNLLSNAVKFTPENGRINIRIHKISEEQVDIEFADTGIGFDQETHVLLSQNTERVPSTAGTNKEKGYGIGLSLCKKMLKQVNSRIVYTANEPQGSIFTLELHALK
ncbi:tetratricopeptide repeat-containing sensor histidine kinase [Flavobacteriaceae bacterium F08102]|nr:tetratricopeptide repeat-containing sensor histidine kinase [Flavobacteriaceae bacterium F08102]